MRLPKGLLPQMIVHRLTMSPHGASSKRAILPSKNQFRPNSFLAKMRSDNYIHDRSLPSSVVVVAIRLTRHQLFILTHQTHPNPTISPNGNNLTEDHHDRIWSLHREHKRYPYSLILLSVRARNLRTLHLRHLI